MDPTVAAVHAASIGLEDLAIDQFARIRRAIGDARVVLIGEETHGTQEFYELRAAITRALIEREGFSLVLCESDFPTFYKLHRFVGGTHASRASLASSSSATSGSWASPPHSPSSLVCSPSASTPLLAADAKTPLPSYGTRDYAEELLASPSPSPSSSPSSATPPPRVTADEVMEVLKERFPVWMWRNEVVRDFVEWLQRENLRRELQPTPTTEASEHEAHVETAHQDRCDALPVALFGLDIYSMFASTDQVVAYLDAVDPAMAARARRRYGVLQHFRPHEDAYCRAVGSGRVAPQHTPLQRMVHELRDHAREFKNVFGDGDEFFNAYENARVVLAAEAYYRQSYLGGNAAASWNIRDRAMVELIVDALAFHDDKLQQRGLGNRQARAVVWAHNSHIGDGAATELMAQSGQVNVGHLVRQALGPDACFLLGLSTATGTVRAARRWNGRDHVLTLRPPLRDSTGDVLHAVAVARAAESGQTEDASFGVVLRCVGTAPALSQEERDAARVLQTPRLERFVGVQYLKQQERSAHYVRCRFSDQFDMVIHVDATTALRPLAETLVSEPHPTLAQAPKATATRPGTVDYIKWDRLVNQYEAEEGEEGEEGEDDDDEAMAVPP